MSSERRDFLRTTGAVALGAAVATATSTAGTARAAAPATATGLPPSLISPWRAASDPQITRWEHAKSSSFEQDWTVDFQGMCTDGRYWYVVSNYENANRRRVYKLSFDLRTVVGYLGAPSSYLHIGSPTYDSERRLVYVPTHEGTEPTMIWKINPDPLTTHSQVRMLGRTSGSRSPQKWKNPWLAYNSFDRLVYSSWSGSILDDDSLPRAEKIWGYDRDTGLLVKEIGLPSGLHHVQGGTFGYGGRNLFLASDYPEASNGRKHIYSYDFTNVRDGDTTRSWGKIAIPHSDDEVECVTLAHLDWSDARDTYITVGILDDDWPSRDDVYFRHFWVPSPADL
ncbi:hypothetical protein [Streptomyces sp. NPDC059828]|uniref:hypothetical protein n=1 Tax=Streptomyces sp. NPDC059828 TaxID=3346965 RepID=UPI00364FBD03